MKKLLIITSALALPFISQAQEVGISENYQTKKEKRLSKFTPLQAGNLIVSAGFGSAHLGLGLQHSVAAEYMLNERLGIRASYSTNNLTSIHFWGGYDRVTLDMTYHFIQEKRWDVYAFAGMGAERFRFRYGANSEQISSTIKPVLNAGVGARYKVTPNFGLQLELGRVSSFGIHKKFNFKRN